MITDNEKRIVLMVQMDEDFMKHIKKTARDKKITLSKFVRASLAKTSAYKEKSLV